MLSANCDPFKLHDLNLLHFFLQISAAHIFWKSWTLTKRCQTGGSWHEMIEIKRLIQDIFKSVYLPTPPIKRNYSSKQEMAQFLMLLMLLAEMHEIFALIFAQPPFSFFFERMNSRRVAIRMHYIQL